MCAHKEARAQMGRIRLDNSDRVARFYGDISSYPNMAGANGIACIYSIHRTNTSKMLIRYNCKFIESGGVFLNTEWVELIKDAEGRSEYVMAIALDIRGFTAFCQTIDSVDVATYIKKLYVKILDEYFPNSTYSKPMGDGLFITIRYDEENLEALTNELVDNCIKLVDTFKTLLVDDSMITYDVPEKVGIGITRGSACCIATGDKIIDYSGKTLNHAARLVEKARPFGIVCDFIEFNNIIKPEIRELFEEDAVCLRGISEDEPIKILYLKDKVKINEKDRLPINEPMWHVFRKQFNYRTIKAWVRNTIFPLDKKPVSTDNLVMIFDVPRYINGEIVEGMILRINYDCNIEELTYNEKGGRPQLELQTKNLKDLLEELDLHGDDDIKLEIRYTI